MTKFVPYLADEAIERDVAALLAEYARARGVIIKPPIPIEDIVEKHLKLGIEFDDTHRLFGVPRTDDDPDILGAMFFEEARIRSTRALIRRSIRRGKVAIVSHWLTRAAGIGACIVICSPRTRPRLPYSAGQLHRRSFAGQAKPKSE
jgi:hypothetical protein